MPQSWVSYLYSSFYRAMLACAWEFLTPSHMRQLHMSHWWFRHQDYFSSEAAQKSCAEASFLRFLRFLLPVCRRFLHFRLTLAIRLSAYAASYRADESLMMSCLRFIDMHDSRHFITDIFLYFHVSVIIFIVSRYFICRQRETLSAAHFRDCLRSSVARDKAIIDDAASLAFIYISRHFFITIFQSTPLRLMRNSRWLAE